MGQESTSVADLIAAAGDAEIGEEISEVPYSCLVRDGGKEPAQELCC